jgi:hypothetical protein
MHALATERVEEDRKGGCQRLALAGPHLGDAAVVEHHAPNQLDVEMAHVERAAACLTAEREGLVEQVVQRLSVASPLAQLVGLLAELVVLEQLHLRLERVDPGDAPLILLELARFAHSQGAIDQFLGHGCLA